MKGIRRFLEKKLKLKVNEKKTRVAPTDQINFLGFTFRGDKIHWSEKAFKEVKRRVLLLTGKSWFVSMNYRLKKLASISEAG